MDLLNILIKIGPGVFFLSVTLAIVYGVSGHIPRNEEGKAQVGRYVLGLAMVGAVAFVAGAALGIAWFCGSDGAGNLCGLGGIFGSGPLLAGIAIVISAHRQVTSARDAR
ncbi:hypothetical protein YTPLAS18_29890 [Nitrospira sp.]|nr:hypothetical protein YTPLAS18_29890 [Nitrospira sp.]